MRGEVITIENGIVNTPQSVDIWMTQHEIANLFGCFVSKINANVRAILKTGILDERTVCRTYYYSNGNSVEQYNLEMITALAFRIKSRNSGIFREWLMNKAVANVAGISILMYKNWSNFQLN